MSNYKPIEDYALIGDCHGAALVARNGDIDWCALGRFDAEPILFPILDSKKGGAWSIAIEGSTVSRAYGPSSNILRTVFETSGGTVEVLDFMPVGRRADAGAFDYVTLSCVGWVVRRVRVLSGEVDLAMTFRPAGPNWDRVAGRIALKGHEALLERADTPERCAAFYADGPLSLDEGAKTLTSREKLTEGDLRHYILTAAPETSDPFARVEKLRAITHAFWTEWADFCRYDGPHREQVLRSALALKLLTYAPTGAIVAAATTSLPEEIGGERNWDYRYCWIRDSALTLYALSAIGYSGEGRQFSRFLMSQPLPRFTPLQIMYGVHGERALLEENLTHLEGYKGSGPVRIGNGAHDQLQLDIYGEMLDLAQIRVRLGAKLNPRERTLLSDAADEVARIWDQPDAGLWEARSGARHYAHSKMMAWVALDRAIDLMGPRPHWEAARKACQDAMEAGTEGGHLPRVLPFRGEPGGEGMDAALLLAPVHGLTLPNEVLDQTVRAVEAELRDGDFVHRYFGGDGLEGAEGAFLICSFWLVDALLATGRADEAEALFDRLCALGNDVGLFAEEADPESGAHLGNFPQAFTHLALIGSAVNLSLYKEGGAAAIRGSYADRAARSTVATEGLRGLLATIRQTKRPVRLRASKASVLRAS